MTLYLLILMTAGSCFWNSGEINFITDGWIKPARKSSSACTSSEAKLEVGFSLDKDEALAELKAGARVFEVAFKRGRFTVVEVIRRERKTYRIEKEPIKLREPAK